MMDSTTTWGISGQVFLGAFALAALTAWLLGLVMRHRLRVGRLPSRDLHPYELAYLEGGPRLVVAAVLAGLRLSGAVASRPGGSLQTGGVPVAARSPLDEAVLKAAGRGVRTGDLAEHSLLRPRMAELREGLRAEGLLLGPDERRSVRAAALPLVFVLLVGLARLVAGVQNDRPVGFLIAMLVVVAVVLVFLLIVPEKTRSVPVVLNGARTRYSTLEPSASPDWRSHGTEAAAMAVALFGVGTLVAMDPQFAAEAEIQQRLGQPIPGSSDGGSSGGGCGGGDGGGGGGCGGGGCGGCGG